MTDISFTNWRDLTPQTEELTDTAEFVINGTGFATLAQIEAGTIPDSAELLVNQAKRVTLEKIRNSSASLYWSNPAKSGIVSPVYNSADTVTYAYGPSADFGTATASAAEFDWAGFDGSIGDVDGAHFGVFVKWDVKPGPKVITGFSTRGAYLQDAHIYSYAVEVWREDATEYTRIATTGDIAADASTGATSITLAKTLATPLSVTLVTGSTYYIGLRIIRKQTGAGYPYLAVRSTAYTCLQPNFAMSCIAASWNGSTISKTNVAAEHNAITTVATNVVGMHFIYTSTNYLEQEITNANFINKTTLLACPLTSPYVVKLEGLVVGDTRSLVATFSDFGATAFTNYVVDTLELDSGNTTAGQNDLIFKGNTINLPNINSKGQEGCTVDLMLGVRPQADNTVDYDLYWQNRLREVNIHAHSVKNGGSRGSLYTYSTNAAEFRMVTFTGDYNSMVRIVVGTRPMVMIGDSQCISGLGDAQTKQPNTSRWGALPTALTKPRIWILHGQAGQYVGVNASGQEANIFSHATPGVGDGRELLGLGCDWWFAGIGINDTNYWVALPAAASATTVLRASAATIEAIASIVDIITAAGERPILTGLPPFSLTGYGAESQYYANAVRAYNRALLGLALAWGVPFYNPWLDMVDPATVNDDMPAFTAAYTDDAGQHYSVAGGAIVRVKMVECIENSTIDLRDAWD